MATNQFKTLAKIARNELFSLGNLRDDISGCLKTLLLNNTIC